MEAKALQFMKIQLKFNDQVIVKNIDEISNEEALIFPAGGANPANWIFGHLIFIRNSMIEILGGKAVWNNDAYTFYERGAEPKAHTGKFPEFDILKNFYSESRIILDRLLSETEYINEKDAEDLAALMLHEIYHAGQLGYMRRLLGKEGAVK